MKAYAIVIDNNEISESGYSTLAKSSWDVENEFTLDRFNAIIPKNVEELMSSMNVWWNYPWEGSVIDFQSGLVKTAYTTKDFRKRMACSMSHFCLWNKSYETGENILVLEHDAKFIRKMDIDISKTSYGVIGINNPLGATRKSQIYHSKILNNPNPIQQVPYVDDDTKVPQGLAGNSAYIITPWAAEEIIDKVYEYGLWPNDALMCRQIFSFLGVSKKYYTEIQKLPSTTTL